MTTDVVYCASGCRDADEHGKMHPRQTGGPQLCVECEKHLVKTLGKIGEAYPRLRAALAPGSVPRDPDSKATKRTDAPIPIRLVVADLLDERHIRIADRPYENVRGALGVVQRWANFCRQGRGGATNPHPTMAGELATIRVNVDWLIWQPPAANAREELVHLARVLDDARGEFRAKPVGRCNVDVQDDDDSEPYRCNGPLFPIGDGVKCIRCNCRWDPATLRLLGSTLRAPA